LKYSYSKNFDKLLKRKSNWNEVKTNMMLALFFHLRFYVCSHDQYDYVTARYVKDLEVNKTES